MAIDLPHAGPALFEWFQVPTKAGIADERKGLPKRTHQATVWAEAVVELIGEMKRCGNQAYRDMHMIRVQAKARSMLPENGAPGEIMHLLPWDSKDGKPNTN